MIKRDSAYALNRVRHFIGTIADAPDEHLDVITLVLALTHVKSISPNVCAVLVTGEANSGKTTLSTNIPRLLASNPFAVSRLTSSDAVRNKFLERVQPDTLLFDDASKIWGASGRQSTTNVQTQLAVNSYEDTGTVSVSRQGSTVEVPAYCVSFYNGLGNVLPDDVATRCIKLPLVKRSEGARSMRGALSVPVRLEAGPLKQELHRWSTANRRQMAQWLIENGHRIHPLLNDRLLQLWGPLAAIANAAGGVWPGKFMDAFLALGLDESEKPVPQVDEKALLDTAAVIMRTGAARIFTADLIPELRKLDVFYRKADSNYLIRELLPSALGTARVMRGRNFAGKTVMAEGWLAPPVLEAAAELQESLRPVTAETGPDRVQQALTMTEVA